MADYIVYIIICAVVLLVLGILITWRILKKRRAKLEQRNEVYDQVHADFEEAEKKYKEVIANGKTIDPHTILWEIARRNEIARAREAGGTRENYSTAANTARFEQRAPSTEVRRDIPIPIAHSDKQEHRSNPTPKRKPKVTWN
jgi:predicted negative regulator of RcsB-dependent stress response